MQKTIDMKGADGTMIAVPMRADAAVPILYRQKFGRDIFSDLGKMASGFEGKKKGDAALLEGIDLELISNLAYIFAKRADKTISDDQVEWLSQFDMMELIYAAADIIGLWQGNASTQSQSKKNSVR